MRGVECAQGYWVMYYRCTHDVVTCAMRGVKRRQDCWVYYRCTHDAVTCAIRGVKHTSVHINPLFIDVSVAHGRKICYVSI